MHYRDNDISRHPTDVSLCKPGCAGPTNERASALFGHLLDLFFPSLCYGCGDPSPPDAPLCWRCIDRLEPVGPVDSAPISPEVWCRAPLDVFCAWRFNRHGPIARLIRSLKYDNRPWLGTALGRALAAAIRSGGSTPAGLVVPVPLHALKMLERGYNQAAWIGRSLAVEMSLEFLPGALRRTRTTATQTRLSREERWTNVSGAFRAETNLNGAHVLVVDDVITTGATVHAVADALLDAGAESVQAAAICLSSA